MPSAKDDRSTPVIIYQMGKVGSTSIYKSLKNEFPEVYQIHSLHPKKLAKTTRILRQNGLGIPKHVRQSNHLVSNFISGKKPVKIITPIRAPLARNVSAFFQELSSEIILQDRLRDRLNISSLIRLSTLLPLPNEMKNALIYKLIGGKLHSKIDVLVDYFKSHYRHRIPLDWFQAEFKESLHIDIFKKGFDIEKRYQRYSRGNIEVLIFQSEMSNGEKENILKDFLDLENITIKNEHTSASKDYSDVLQAFKEKLEADTDFCSQFLHSNYVSTFYGNLLMEQ